MSLPTAALKTFHWRRHGRYQEFDPFTTHPQQDHRADGTGITIRRVTDRRAQPWQQLVEANMHDKKIRNLPSVFADRREVQEFIYLVLAKSTSTDIKSVYITVTVSRCPLNGLTLRTLITLNDFLAFIPTEYTDVYHDTHQISEKQRIWLAERMRKLIRPLVELEQKENVVAMKALRKLRLREAKAEAKTLAKAKKQLKMSDREANGSRVMACLRGLLCFGSKADYAESLLSVDTLPMYKEKM